jgi:hypothetical protein
LYNVKAHFGTNGTFLGCSGNVSVDTRYFTHMWVRWRYDGSTTWEGEIANSSGIDLVVNVAYEFHQSVLPVKSGMGWGYSNSVEWYVNGEFLQETSYIGFLDWVAYDEDTYYFRLHYKGGVLTRPSTWVFIVQAQIDPVMVYFDVTPTKFAPGATVSLYAQAVDAELNQTLRGNLTFTFLQDGDWNYTIQRVNSSTGEATVNWTYPDQDVHTVTVVVQLSTGSQVKHMVEPVYLEVIGATTLRLGVNRTASSSHRFEAQLLDATGSPVANMPLTAYLNNTRLDENLVTNATGHVTFTRNLNPGQDRVAYMVQVAFEGTGNQTATLNGTDFMGNPYIVCQTMQCTNIPAANMTLVVVEPQATDVTGPSKTPDELQQDAEQNGWVSPPRPKFSWRYPWFWLETTASYPSLSFGFVTCVSPIDGWLEDFHGFENPLYKIFEGVSPERVDTLTSVAVASATKGVATFVGGYVLLLLQGGNIFGSFLVQLGYVAASLLLIWYLGQSDAYLARAALIALGWTLLSISTLGLTRILPVLASGVTGTDPVAASVRSIVNTLLGAAISTAILRVLKVNLYQFLFYMSNVVLGMVALGAGYLQI